jgi:hypothetical protein
MGEDGGNRRAVAAMMSNEEHELWLDDAVERVEWVELDESSSAGSILVRGRSLGERGGGVLDVFVFSCLVLQRLCSRVETKTRAPTQKRE